MLNTDMCLFFDVETTFPCCSNVNVLRGDGSNACDRNNGDILSGTPCGTYEIGSGREEAANAVELFAQRRETGGFRNDNSHFFTAFEHAWSMATNNGWLGLEPLALSCVPTPPPSPAPTHSPTNTPTAKPTEVMNVSLV